MLAKKFLIPLLTLGVIGGSSGAIYYSVNKENDQKIAKDFSSPVDIPKNNEDINGQQVEQVDSNEDGKDGKVGEDNNLGEDVVQNLEQNRQDSIKEPEDKDDIQISVEDIPEEKNTIIPVSKVQQIEPEIKADTGTSVDSKFNTELTSDPKIVPIQNSETPTRNNEEDGDLGV